MLCTRFDFSECSHTVNSQVLTTVYNMEINIFPKCQSKRTQNFPFIDNLKYPACASKREGLVLATLRYLV